MIIKRTYDSDVIDSVLKHDEVRPYIIDDSTDGFIDYPIIDEIYYLAAYEDDEIVGLFVLHPMNNNVLQGHTSVLPKYRGKKALEAIKSGIDWVFKNTEYDKIIGITPIYNKKAVAYSKKAGFEIEGINKKSIMKNGKLHDQIYFGLRRESWL